MDRFSIMVNKNFKMKTIKIKLIFIMALISVFAIKALPEINFYPGKHIIEGESAEFTIDIYGDYSTPIAITYNILGASPTIDYTVPATTTITITRGNSHTITLETLVDDDLGREQIAIELTTINNAIAGGNTRAIVYIFGSEPNSNADFRVLITDTNITDDSGQEVANNFIVANDNKRYTIDYVVDNIVDGSTNTTLWASTNTATLDAIENLSTDSKTFVFNNDLEAGAYRIISSTFNTPTVVLSLTNWLYVLPSLPSNYGYRQLVDNNDNGITDIVETDLNLQYLSLDGVKVYAQPGVKLKLGALHYRVSDGLVRPAPITNQKLVAVYGDNAIDYNFTSNAVINISASGKPYFDASQYHFVFEFDETITENTVVRQFYSTGISDSWRQLRATANIRSIPKTGSRCPIPGNRAYFQLITENNETRTIGLEPNTNCLQLSVIDGFINDQNLSVNGIVDLALSLRELRVANIVMSASSKRANVGDTILITASVSDKANLPVANAKVNFGLSSNVIASFKQPLSKITNNLGEATATITVNAQGDLVVSASIDTVTDVFTVLINSNANSGIGSISISFLLLLLLALIIYRKNLNSITKQV